MNSGPSLEVSCSAWPRSPPGAPPSYPVWPGTADGSPCLITNWNGLGRYLAENCVTCSPIRALSSAASSAGAPGMTPSMVIRLADLVMDNDDSSVLLELAGQLAVQAPALPDLLRLQRPEGIEDPGNHPV